MPPLKSGRQFESHITEAETELWDKIKEERRDLYSRMFLLVNPPSKLDWFFGNDSLSAKALYRVEGQPESQYTRAWLRQARGIGSITLMTDKISYNRGYSDDISKIRNSEFEHFALSNVGSALFTDHYLNIDTTQEFQLIEDAHETISLIEQADIALKANSLRFLR